MVIEKNIKNNQLKIINNQLIRIASLLFLIILGGCKARQLVRPTPQMDIEPQFWIRVLLLNDVADCTLKIGSPFSIVTMHNSTANKQYARQANVPIKVSVSAGRIIIAGQSLTNDEVTISPDNPHIFNLNGNDYRGKLKIKIGPDGSSFDAINLVPLEPYLAGVVGAEMPDYWEPAALKAQAVASRTYCLYIKKRFGSTRAWDVRKTQANQVYLGVGAESTQTWNTVNKTYGRVLVCKHSDGTEGIFPTYYSSVCGGHTEDSEYVFGDSFEALVGRPCPYCKDIAKPRYFFWPTVEFDKSYVTARLSKRYPKLKQLGEITNIIAARQSNYGNISRVTLVKLVGATGKSNFLRAEDFRLTIDPTGRKLQSTIYQVVNKQDKWAFLSGTGFGHGVGMCQCGAQAMAREGNSANQILSYYYRDSKIVRVY
jgi:stage II sporulation protein D